MWYITQVQTIEAIFEKGVFRPIGEIELKEGERVEVILPVGDAAHKARIIESPVTGLPVIDAGEDAPVLTSEMVKELLIDFP